MSGISWRELLVAAAGVVLMTVPDRAGVEGTGADALHLLGTLIATFALLATAGVLRPLRWVNVLLGVAAMATAFVFDLGGANAAVVTIAAGGAAAAAAATDQRDKRFGGRWIALLRREKG